MAPFFFLRGVDQAALDLQALVFQRRVALYVADGNPVFGFQEKFSDSSVPDSLYSGGVAVAPGAQVGVGSIVYGQKNPVLTLLEVGGDVVFMWGA